VKNRPSSQCAMSKGGESELTTAPPSGSLKEGHTRGLEGMHEICALEITSMATESKSGEAVLSSRAVMKGGRLGIGTGSTRVLTVLLASVYAS
jgi:hypothetical protein